MINLSSIAPGLVLPAAVRAVRYPTVEAWRTGRLAGLGASDVPRVLGLSPHGGPWSVFADKLQIAHPERETDRQRRGSRWEIRILEDFHDDTGLTVVGPLGHIAIEGPERWLRVTPDAFIRGPDAWDGGELKTDTSEIGRWAWGDSGQTFATWEQARGHVREDYAAQLYTQLWATGLEWGRLIVRRNLDDQRWYRLRRDETIIAWMRPQLEAFWGLVEAYRSGDTSAYPDPDDSDACAGALARMLPEGRDLVLASSNDQDIVRDIREREALLDSTLKIVRVAKARLAERITRAGAYGLDLGDGDKVLYQRGAGSSRFIRIYQRGQHAV